MQRASKLTLSAVQAARRQCYSTSYSAANTDYALQLSLITSEAIDDLPKSCLLPRTAVPTGYVLPIETPNLIGNRIPSSKDRRESNASFVKAAYVAPSLE